MGKTIRSTPYRKEREMAAKKPAPAMPMPGMPMMPGVAPKPFSPVPKPTKKVKKKK